MKQILPLLVIFALCADGVAAEPAWWRETGTRIIDETGAENNYGPANLGQLKNVATQAKTHLDTALAPIGGAGPDVDAVVNPFVSDPASNYSPANIGQLKALAAPFYDRSRRLDSRLHPLIPLTRWAIRGQRAQPTTATTRRRTSGS